MSFAVQTRKGPSDQSGSINVVAEPLREGCQSRKQQQRRALTNRTLFNQACDSFIRKNSLLSANDLLYRSHHGWQWHEHTTIPGLGYMSRLGSATCKASGPIASRGFEVEPFEEMVEDDISTLPPSVPKLVPLLVYQYVVFSPTFQVPAFYFTVHTSDGSPLPLEEILQSTLFYSHALPGNLDVAPHGVSLPASSFPLLSQGDHPIIGTPAWYFHPCETSAAVMELLHAIPMKDLTEDGRLLRWLEVWFLVLGSVVDLR